MIEPHVTPGFETDLTAAIRRWQLDSQMQVPAQVLTRFVFDSLTALETALRRREDFARARRAESAPPSGRRIPPS